jgi:DNA-binding transcriptional regulator YiaG
MAMKKNYSKEMRDHGISRTLRQRLRQGEFRGGSDVKALRRFVRMSQSEFAHALGISIRTLQNWEQDVRMPEGPALALLSIAAAHPRIIRARAREQSAA